MIFDDEFKPRLGKARSSGGRAGDRFVNRVLVAANRMRGGPALKSSGRMSRFDGSRIGRGAGAGRVLSAKGTYSALRQRRVIIKSRIVRMIGKASSFGRAHLSYIQRDGVTRDGQPGQLYDQTQDRADGGAFIERGGGDRHQHRRRRRLQQDPSRGYHRKDASLTLQGVRAMRQERVLSEKSYMASERQSERLQGAPCASEHA